MAILGLGQKIYKRSLDHLVMPESKNVIFLKNHIDGNVTKEKMEQFG